MEELFSKVLSPHDIEHRMALPMSALDHFVFPAEENHIYFMVTDSDDQNQYQFRLPKRNRGTHPKPAITGGWLEFVRYRDLRAEKKVTLYVQQDEAGAAHYVIEVKRGIRLFGVDL